MSILNYSNELDNDFADICAVCLEKHQNVCATPCQHMFCQSCIERLLSFPRQGTCPMCRAKLSLYNVINVASGLPLRRPDVLSLLSDTVFVQKWGTVGLASYHFGATRCFIQYRQGVIPDDWKCDDGSNPPEEKDFLDWHYDDTTRRFTGKIKWENGFWGTKEWSYDLHFDEGLMVICAGSCNMSRLDGSSPHIMYFYDESSPEPVYYRRVNKSMYGSVYVPKFGHIGSSSYHFLENGESYVDFSNPLEWWIDEMAAEFPDRINFTEIHFEPETRTFYGTIDLSQSPFGNEIKWRYKMEFDEAYGTIVGGGCECLCSDGSVKFRPFESRNERRDIHAPVLQYQIVAPWDNF